MAFFLFQFYDGNKALLSAFNLSIFPVFYFFTFLYYTDVGSTFLVLLMYSLHLDKWDWSASFIGKRFAIGLSNKLILYETSPS